MELQLEGQQIQDGRIREANLHNNNKARGNYQNF